MMIKKLKNMDGFRHLYCWNMSLFGIFALLLVITLPIYTVASYQHKELHQGTITDKYNRDKIKKTSSILYSTTNKSLKIPTYHSKRNLIAQIYKLG